MENKILRFVEFKDIESWSTYAILGSKFDYSNQFELAKIRHFLKRNKTQVSIKDEILYKRPTIKINGQGIFLRDEKQGKDIGTKNQFRIRKGQFLLSKIDARNGAFGVVPKELDNGIITGNFWTFDVDYEKINPYFLTLVTKTKKFQNLSQSASVGTTNRNYLQEEEFLNFQIPLPSLDEQEAIVSAYQSKIEEAQRLENEAQELENEIENYLFEELGVSFQKYENLQSGKLHFVDFKDMESWGVSNNFSDSPSNIFQSKKYPLISIQNFFLINPTTNISVDEEISFIPMASVSDEYGEIIKKENRKLAKGYTRFQENDILWARITPCMENGKSSIAKELKNGFGFGSTEFHILRKFSNGLNEELLHLLLRTSYLRQNAKKYFTGSAGQQRVPKSYLENLKIPIPPLSKQNEIAATIATMKQTQKQKTKTATRLRAKALAEFEQVIFN